MSQKGSGQPEPRSIGADTELASFRESRQKTIDLLVTLADELEETLEWTRKAKIIGEGCRVIAASIRASSPPLDSDAHAVGTFLYWAGGITVAGTTVAEVVKKCMTTAAVNKVLKDDNAALMEYKKALNGVNVEVDIKSTLELQKGHVADIAKFVGTVIILVSVPIDVSGLVSTVCGTATDLLQSLPTQLRTLAEKLKDDLEQLQLDHEKKNS